MDDFARQARAVDAVLRREEAHQVRARILHQHVDDGPPPVIDSGLVGDQAESSILYHPDRIAQQDFQPGSHRRSLRLRHRPAR